MCERLTRPGVSVGLAWTGKGGEIMFVETSKMEGTGELVLTGQLGDVMKESAQIALNWVRSSSRTVRDDVVLRASVCVTQGYAVSVVHRVVPVKC